MKSIILENSHNIKIKINKKIYEEFSNLKNYNKELIGFNSNKNIIIKSAFINKTVPNIVRYQVDIFKDTDDIVINSILNKKNIIKNSNYNDIILNEVDLNMDNSIALILESPHKAEFDYIDNDLSPISPAQGSTGINIDTRLKKLLGEIIKNNCLSLQNRTYKLVIINPISFQTSLHFFHRKSLNEYHFKKLRDKVWHKIWENDESYKRCLNNNLKKINSKLIINACTSNLSPFIQEQLKINFKNKTIVETYHPSAWIFNGFGLN